MKWTLVLLLPALGIGVWAVQESVTGSPASSENGSPSETSGPRLVYAPGVVEGKSRTIDLRFEIAGRVTEILVAEDDAVSAGQSLARLDASALRGEVGRARANLALAKAKRARLCNGARAETKAVALAQVARAEVDVARARRDRERASHLRAQGDITASAWDGMDFAARLAAAQLAMVRARADEVEADAREDELAVADAEILVAQAELDLAEARLDKTVLVAPCDGIVLRVEVEPGQVLGPETPFPVARMVNDEEVRVRAYVEEYDAPAVRTGQWAWISTEHSPDQRLAGEVVHCSPLMSPKSQRTDRPGERLDVRVREIVVRVDDPADLVFGLPVDVCFDSTFGTGDSNRPLEPNVAPSTLPPRTARVER